MDLRHRPRRDRHPGQGRAGARGRGHQQGGAGARRVRRPGVEVAARVRRPDQPAVPQPGRIAGLCRRALHDGRGLRPGRAGGVRPPVREGPGLPRQLHGQLGPGNALGDLRPGGGAAQRGRHAVRDRLPAGVGLGVGHRCHGPPRDDAGRYRDSGAPVRRALHAPDRRASGVAAGGPLAADHRRRVREDRLRHRGAEDHPRARPERLRDRSRPRAAGDLRDRRGRPDDGGGGGAVRRHDRRGLPPRGGGGAAQRRLPVGL